MVGEVAQGGPVNEKQAQGDPHVPPLSPPGHTVSKAIRRKSGPLCCASWPLEKRTRMDRKPEWQPLVSCSQECCFSNSSLEAIHQYTQKCHNPVLILKGTSPALWFLTDHADSGEAMEKGLKEP